MSEIASWTAHSRNFPNNAFALPKWLGDLFESQKLQIYPFRKRKRLLWLVPSQFWGLKIYSDTRFQNARACVFDYSKSLAHLALKLIFTENNRWVPCFYLATKTVRFDYYKTRD